MLRAGRLRRAHNFHDDLDSYDFDNHDFHS